MKKRCPMTEKLCEDECDINNCPDEPCHCPFGLEQLQERAELRADLAKDERSGL